MPLRHLHGCCNLFAHKANKSQQSCLPSHPLLCFVAMVACTVAATCLHTGPFILEVCKHLHGCCNLCALKANKSQQSLLITQGIDLLNFWRQPGNHAIGNDAILSMESISLEEMPAATIPSLHQDFVFELCLSSQLNQCLHNCRNLICILSILSKSCFITTSHHVLCLHGCWNPSQILLR